jgi:hypothetical protein
MAIVCRYIQRSQFAGEQMCAMCDELDTKIQQFKRLMDPTLDALTLKIMGDALASLERERAAHQCDNPPK